MKRLPARLDLSSGRLVWALTGLGLLTLSACMNRGETRSDPPKRNHPVLPITHRPPTPQFPEPQPPPLIVPAQYPHGVQLATPLESRPNRARVESGEPRIQVRQIQPGAPPLELPEKQEDEALLCALRAYLDNRPEKAEASLAEFDTPNREALTRLLAVTVRLSETDLNSTDPDELAGLIEQLYQVGDQLRPHASLKTGTVCFCRGVTRFGEYLPYDKNPSFRPGERAEVYVELHNFHNEPAQDPTGNGLRADRSSRGSQGKTSSGRGERMYRNRFRGELAVRDADGTLVWKDDWHFSAYSRTPRRDSHLVIGFEAPRELPSGRYSLAISLMDEPTGRKTQRILGFWISSLEGRR